MVSHLPKYDFKTSFQSFYTYFYAQYKKILFRDQYFQDVQA